MERMIWVLDDAKATALINQGATAREVAEALGVSRQTVYSAIRKGRIPRPGELGSPIDAEVTPPSTPRAEA